MDYSAKEAVKNKELLGSFLGRYNISVEYWFYLLYPCADCDAEGENFRERIYFTSFRLPDREDTIQNTRLNLYFEPIKKPKCRAVLRRSRGQMTGVYNWVSCKVSTKQ